MFSIEYVIVDEAPWTGAYVRENWKMVPAVGDEIAIADIGRFVVTRRAFVEADHADPVGEGKNKILLYIRRAEQ